MYKVSRVFDWSMAHRLIKGYKGKCNNIHGHNYKAKFSFKKEELNDKDFVIDFKEIENFIGNWIDNNLDHVFLVYKEDKKVLDFLKENSFKYYVIENNTTAERIAQELFYKIKMKYNFLYKVDVWEAAKSKATYIEGEEK